MKLLYYTSKVGDREALFEMPKIYESTQKSENIIQDVKMRVRTYSSAQTKLQQDHN